MRSKEITESQAWLRISALIKLALSIWASFTLRPQSLTCEFHRRVEALNGTLLSRPGRWRAMGSVLVTGLAIQGIPSLPPGPGSSQLLPSIYHHLTLHIAQVSLGASLYRRLLAKDFNTSPSSSPNQLNSALFLLRTGTRADCLLKIWQVGWRLPWALPAHPPTWTHLVCLPTRTVLGTSSLLRPHFSPATDFR